MRVLITGVTGFAGSYLAEHLLACGDEVLGASRRGKWEIGVPQRVQDSVELLTGDLTVHEPLVQNRLRRFAPQCVYHLAGMSVPADCGDVEPTAEATDVNVSAVRRVIDSCPDARLVFASSCHVYAAVRQDAPEVVETSPLGPAKAYGKTKLAAEDVVLSSCREGRLDAVIARAFNHSGPRQAPRMMLPEWARQLARGAEHLEIYSADSYLDLTDVRDLVRIYRELAMHGECGQVYNAGSGRNLRSGDILEHLLQRYDAGCEIVERQPGRQQLPIADLTRLRETIDWRPEISLQVTAEETLRYWQSREQAK